MKIVCINVLISILFLKQILNVLSHSIVELTLGELYDNTQLSKSLSFYKILDLPNKDIKIFLRKERGFPRLYGYFMNNESELPTTESEISELEHLGALENAQNIYHTSYIEINKNSIDLSNEQYIIIVFCPDKTECSFSIAVPDTEESLKLKENKTYLFYFKLKLPIMFSLNQTQISDNSHLNIYITPIHGIINSIDFKKNTEEINPTEQVLSINDFYSFILTEEDKDSIFNLQFETNHQSSIFLFRYSIEESSIQKIQIEIGITQMYDITKNEKKIFFVESLSNELVLFFKAQSCSLHIQEVEKSELVNEYYSSFYQVIYYPTDSYQIEINLDERENQSKSCKFFSYSYENEINGRTILAEGIEQQFKFTKDINQFILICPFFYSSKHNSVLYMNTCVSNNEKVYIRREYDDNKHFSYKKDILFSNSTTLLQDEIKENCREEKLCLIKITIQPYDTFESDYYFSIQFGSSKVKQMYCHKNSLCSNYYRNDQQLIMYSEVKTGEIGQILWNYQNELIQLFFQILDRNDLVMTKGNLINHEEGAWEEMDIHERKVDYYVDETLYSCAKGCELYVIIKNLESQDSEYTINKGEIAIREMNAPVIGKLYYLLSGHISEEKENFTYIYTMPKTITGFQIKIFGYHTTFYIEDLNSTYPCCENINKNYSSKMNKKFIDFYINKNISTSDYNIKILITVIPDEIFVQFEEHYEIEVIPFLYVNYPVRFFDYNGITECQTNKDNKCYLIVNGVNHMTIIYSILNDKSGEIIKYIGNSVNKTEFFSHNWDNYFNNQSNYTDFSFSNSTQHFELYSSLEDIENFKFMITLEFDSSEKIVTFEKKSSPYKSGKLTLMNDVQITRTIMNYIDIQYLSYILDETLAINMNMEFIPIIIMGTGQLHGFLGNIPVVGPTTLILTKILGKDYDLSYEPVNEGFELSIKMNFNIKKPYSFVNLDLLKVNMLSFTSNFPYIIVYQLGENERNFRLNLQFESRDNLTYNYLNLKIEAGYINKNNLNDFYYNNSQGVILIQNVTYINNRQIAVIDFSISEEQREEYEFIFFNIKEEKISNATKINPNIIISGVEKGEQFPNNTLFTTSYFFNYIEPNISNETVYLLSSIGQLITVEFSSCTNDLFDITFMKLNKSPIQEKGKIFINGKTIFELEHIDSGTFYIKIQLKQKNEHHNYDKLFFGIKYHVTTSYMFQSNFTYFSNLTSSYNDGINEIYSNWGEIEESMSLKVKFIYLLYNKTEYFTDSICYIDKPEFAAIANQTNYQYKNEEQKEFDYQSVVIANFYSETDHVLIGYNGSRVYKEYSNTWLWLIIIFVFVIVVFIYTTYLFYKETQVKPKKNQEVLIEFVEKKEPHLMISDM